MNASEVILAEWQSGSCSGLQIRLRRFDSGLSLCPGGEIGRRKGLKVIKFEHLEAKSLGEWGQIR